MNNKQDVLRKYRKQVVLVDNNQVALLEDGALPANWLSILKEKDDRKRVEKTLGLWGDFVSIDLRNTISYLRENLLNIELIKENSKYSRLYSVRVGDGEIDYYEGGIPNRNFENPKLKEAWPKMPQSLKNFYENVHDGFYYYPSRAMGLVYLDRVTFFDDDEWGIIEELIEPLQINLKSTFGFFNSGMGAYVAIDYNNCNNDKATLWFSDEQPKYNVNFGDIVDEWIVMGFE
ncbi:SMI1/KNR4 family protein [Bacillus massilinigeriensis]|uniref:SMI1/KNR4 family protein n=1 Tax=Bacillus mediterraneensis TaxID=1805474 RepID=UPI0008F7ECC9|nr:SMI1/KNR4 family protein [Bacillus mediterraneensis]